MPSNRPSLLKKTAWLLLILALFAVAAKIACDTMAPSEQKTATDASEDDAIHLLPLEAARALIASGADLNREDATGDTPLVRALEIKGNIEAVRLLVEAGADVNQPSGENKNQPLAYAVFREQPMEVISYLLGKGADPNSAVRDGMISALTYAAGQKGGQSVMRALLEAGARATPIHPEKEMAPIFWAINNDIPENIRILVAAGVDPNAPASIGGDPDATMDPPIYQAIFCDSAAALKTLLELGADPNQEATSIMRTTINSPLWLAGFSIGSDSPKIIEQLMLAGADSSKKRQGISLLWTLTSMLPACPEKSRSIAAMLKTGADPDIRNEENGVTPLMIAALLSDSTETVDAFLAAKADVNIADNNGGTALMRAAKNYAHPQIVRRLLDAGADIGMRNSEGETALIIACDKTHEKIPTPEELGEELFFDDEDPGFFKKISDALKTMDADAQKEGRKAVIEALLKAGADPDIKNAKGVSARDLVKNEPEIAALLK